MLFLPYRAKNPPERTPYVTWGLIAINALVFALTSDSFWTVRKDIVEQFAVTHNTLSLVRILTSIFLHGNFVHLAGNMLFLWIFGTSVEGRLGHFKYLGLYLLTGYAGALLQDAILGVFAPDVPSLGASGAIMGTAGAYLYMFPHATICILFSWGFWGRWGFDTIHWPAWGVIAYYLGFDVLDGLLFQGQDGVGHLAHIGGAVAGFLGAMALRPARDTAEYAEAQEMRVDHNDNYEAMGLDQLDLLMAGPSLNVEMVTAYVRRAVTQYSHHPEFTARGIAALHKHAPLLCQRADPVPLAQTILAISEPSDPLPGILLLRLASALERTDQYGLAIPLLQRLYRQKPDGPDAEMALLRLARISERNPDKRQAIAQYQEILRLFPNGRHAMEAHDALLRLGIRR